MSTPPYQTVAEPAAAFPPGAVRVKDNGFTQLHDGGLTPSMDIVFIHGLQGHPKKTWLYTGLSRDAEDAAKSRSLFSGITKVFKPSKSPSGSEQRDPISCYWPADILPDQFPTARILTYGYDSHVSHFFSSPTSQNSISANGRSFLNGLAACRIDNETRPILYIVHSLGGLVLKSALQRSSIEAHQEDLAAVYKAPFAVIFFGTPHRGSAYAEIGSTAARIALVTGFDANSNIVNSLKPNSEILELLREWFAKAIEFKKLQFTSFQEDRGYKNFIGFRGKIVDNDSSALDHPYERKDFINANHMEMCKFRDKDDEEYTKIRAEIIRHAKRLMEDVDQERATCLASLYRQEMYERIDQISSPAPDTLGWLFDPTSQHALLQWLRSDRELFWIRGKAGSGKSTAIKTLLQDPRTMQNLSNTSSAAINVPTLEWSVAGIFYEGRAEPIQRSFEGMLYVMLYHILAQSPSLISGILPIGKVSSQNIPRQFEDPLNEATKFMDYHWTTSKLQRALMHCRNQPDVHLRVCFFVDALDEHDGDDAAMVNFLLDFAVRKNTMPSNNRIKICVASRESVQLLDLLAPYPTFEMQHWTAGDMHQYLNQKLGTHRRLQEFRESGIADAAIQTFFRQIVLRSQGVFLWVRLVAEEILHGLMTGISFKDLESALEKLPDGLQGFYKRMLEKIDRRDRSRGFVMLEIVLRSRKPLTLRELGLVTHFGLDSYGWSQGHVPRRWTALEFIGDMLRDRKGLVRQIKSSTGGLLEVRPKRALHHDLPATGAESADFMPSNNLSAKRPFLINVSSSGNASINHLGIAEQASMLRHDNEPSHHTQEENLADDIDWDSHVYLVHQSVKDYLLLDESLKTLMPSDREGMRAPPMPNGHCFFLWFCRGYLEAMRKSCRDLSLKWDVAAEILYHAPNSERTAGALCFADLDVIDDELSSPEWFNSRAWVAYGSGPYLTFPAYAILVNMPLYLARVLDASRDAGDSLSHRPLLHIAASEKETPLNVPIIRLLLEQGADPNAIYSGESPLQSSWGYASSQTSEHYETVELLLRHGADPNDTPRANLSDVDWSPPAHQAMLSRADLATKMALVKLLHRYGADLNARNGQSLTLLEEIYWRNMSIRTQDWAWLLDMGAKVQPSMVKRAFADALKVSSNLPVLYEDSFTMDHHAYSQLRQQRFRCREYYTDHAAALSWEFNPHWGPFPMNLASMPSFPDTDDDSYHYPTPPGAPMIDIRAQFMSGSSAPSPIMLLGRRARVASVSTVVRRHPFATPAPP